MADVQRRISACPGVAAVHDLHVWTVVNGVVAMSGHAVVPDLVAHPGVLEGIRTEMAALGIGHVTMQLEVADECEEVAGTAGPGRTGARTGQRDERRHRGQAHPSTVRSATLRLPAPPSPLLLRARPP